MNSDNDDNINRDSNMTTSTQESSLNNSSDSKKKKHFTERVGDWVCIKCKNLNFSFRVICNRCNLSKAESEILFESYMRNLIEFTKRNNQSESYKYGNLPGSLSNSFATRNSK